MKCSIMNLRDSFIGMISGIKIRESYERLTERINQRFLKCFGHTERMNEGGIPKNLVERRRFESEECETLKGGELKKLKTKTFVEQKYFSFQESKSQAMEWSDKVKRERFGRKMTRYEYSL